VRYTPDGGDIRLTWKLDGDSPVFAVRDSGEGIAPQHIPHLTERFYRVDTARSRDTGGTGLGLSIVKHILLRHDARRYRAISAKQQLRCVFPLARATYVRHTAGDRACPSRIPARRSHAGQSQTSSVRYRPETCVIQTPYHRKRTHDRRPDAEAGRRRYRRYPDDYGPQGQNRW
jgi:hypothetical protein